MDPDLPRSADYPARTAQQEEEELAMSTASANLTPPLIMVGDQRRINNTVDPTLIPVERGSEEAIVSQRNHARRHGER